TAQSSSGSQGFLCSICLDVFTNPVSTSCGHNFCKDYITKQWDNTDSCQCPKCKEVFKTRPVLQVNTSICESVKAKLVKTEVEIQQMIQKRRLKIFEIRESLKISTDAVDRQKAESVQIFTALQECVEKCLNQLIEELEEQQKTAEKQAEDRNSEVEQLSSSEEHLHFLQSFWTLKAALPTDDWMEICVRPPSYEGTVERAVSQLEEMLTENMKKTKLKQIKKFAVDVTLDPGTAHPNLILTDDGKQVKVGDVWKNLPDSPQRFFSAPCVLGKQSFSSGRFYFEVLVKGKTCWTLGVVRESINRKGGIKVSPRHGYWTIVLRNGNEYKAGDGPSVRLHPRSGPEKVGVFVDYEEGLVSFYDADTAVLIFSFTGCCFTEKLHPYFCPCLNDRGKNSAPLIIFLSRINVFNES
uniref:B30.2/SPRY domain-containing protein n=1 Tax=Amphiprion percula TaxID=161767 RepID=A0A3P8RZK0_AMPPE